VLLKVVRIIGVSIAGMALANVAWAQGVNVTTGAVSADLGGEFRGEWMHHDNGLMKAEGFTPDASDTIDVQHVRITLDGKINNDTEYSFGFNFLNPGLEGPLVYGYGTHWFSKMMGMSVGRMTTAIGGWDNMDSGYKDHAQGWAGYDSNLAFADYEDMIALHMAVAGKISLQLVNDKKADNEVATVEDNMMWNKTSHPTYIISWQGQFGGIQPLVNIGSYDNNKSRWIDVGVKANMSGLAATLDIHSGSEVAKGTDADGKAEGWESTTMAITAKGGYEIKGTATPWVYVSTWDRKQYEDKDAGLEDSKVNADGAWDDNAMTYGLGADLHMMGKGWTPYVALVSRSGKFDKDPTPAEVEEESKSEMAIRLGVLGEI
jgi:hypothetical protein